MHTSAKRTLRGIYVILCLSFLLVKAETGWGQQSITNLAIPSTQNFDAMGSSANATMPAGFRVYTTANWTTGTTATTLAAGTTGTGALNGTSTGGIYNFANGITATSADRALGFLTSGSFTSPRSIIYAFTNNTGAIITSMNVSFDYEKYRSGFRSFNWTFFHGSNPDNINIPHAGGDESYGADLNNTTIFNPPSTISKSFTINNVFIPDGATYYLAWTFAGVGGSTSGQAIGIDNFSITLLFDFADCKTTESFSNLPTGSPTIYLSRSWIGDNGMTWTAAGASTDQTMTGNAIAWGTSGTRNLKSPSIAGGMATLSFDYVRAFTGKAARSLEVYVNNVLMATIQVSDTSNVVNTFSQVIQMDGNVELEIRSTGAGQVKIDNLAWNCCNPAVCVAPLNHVSGLNITGITFNAANITWTNTGNDNSIVLVKAVSDITQIPANNTSYLPDQIFGEGHSFPDGSFVVYAGPGNTFQLTGLSGGTTYHVKIFPYNCINNNQKYLVTGSPATISFTTPPSPVTNLRVTCTTNNSATITWTPPSGDYDELIIGVRQNGDPHALSGTPVLVANNTFPLGTQYGNPILPNTFSYVVYKGTGNNVTVTFQEPQTPYTIKAYVRKGTSWATTTPTRALSVLGVPEVTNLVSTPLNNRISINWTNPSLTCIDEVIIVASTSPVSGIPVGNYISNSRDYNDPLNPAFPNGGKVVYNGLFNIQTITGLTNGTNYFFKLFVRNGEQWSQGIQINSTPLNVTLLDYSDIAILGVNTDIGGGKDEIIWAMFKEFFTGSNIDFTDNGYERGFSGYWGTGEGVIRLTRTGPAVAAGKIVYLQGSDGGANPQLGTNFNVFVDGINDNSNWSIQSLNGSSGFNLTNADQVWIMQGGNWLNEGTNLGSYSGKVLYGWTANGWKDNIGITAPTWTTAGSRLVQGTECSNTNLSGVSNNSKVIYTGPTVSATPRQWVGRINNPANWSGFADNNGYNAGATFGNIIDITQPIINGDEWIGDTSTDWFNCANWGNLRIPDQTTDIFINENSVNNIIVNNSTKPALARSITIGNSARTLTFTGADSELIIEANLYLLSSGLFTKNQGTLRINGNLINDGSFSQIDGKVYLKGNLINSGSFSVPNGELILSGVNRQSISSDSDLSVYQLEANNPQYISIANNLRVNVLKLTKGRLNINSSNYLEIGENTTLRGQILYTSGSVNGRVKRWFAAQTNNSNDGFFPVGSVATHKPVNVVFTIPPTSGGSITAEFQQNTIENHFLGLPFESQGILFNTVSEFGYWRLIKGDNLDGGTYSLTVDIRDFPNINNPERIRILKRENSSTPWSLSGVAGTITASSFTQTGMSGFSDFILGGNLLENPLPIQLLFFKANYANGQVNLTWATASEINNHYFSIERSTDLENIEVVGYVAGAGNSSQVISYNFTDFTPLMGQAYYRLRQTDFDGTSDISRWIGVETNELTRPLKIIQVIHKQGKLQIWASVSSGSPVHLQLFDPMGRQIYSAVENNPDILLEYSLELPTLGIYLLRLTTPLATQTVKFGTR